MRRPRRVFHLNLWRRRDVRRDVDEEIAFHLTMREERLRREGVPATEASKLAARRFGNVDGIRAECLREAEPLARTERAMQWIEEAGRDARLAVRSLLRARGFSAAVVLTLALGLGANATIFAVTDAIVLQPIGGVRQPSELYQLTDVVTGPEFRELRLRLPTTQVAALGEQRIAVGARGSAEHLRGGFVSGAFFDVIGVRAALGRTIVESDDVAGAPAVGVLTYDYWSRAFGADPGIVGQGVLVNGAPVTVIGVAAPGFRGLRLGDVPAIWMPAHAFKLVASSSMAGRDLETAGWGWLRVVGRLAPGETLPQMHDKFRSAMLTITPAANREDVDAAMAPRPAQAAALASGARSAVVSFVAILTGVVVLVLLTACANIAGLLLARSASREREIAVRVAIGAGRGRLLRQLLIEALVLAAAGGVAGIAVFLGARAALTSITFPGGISGASIPLAVDARLVLFLSLVTLATGLLVGLAPAMQGSRPDTVSALKGSGGLRGPRQRLRGVLVTAQVAVGVVLLSGTGLFARALSRALTVKLGFTTEHVLGMAVDPGLARYDPPRAAAYFASVMQAMRSLPGVADATWVNAPPLSNDYDRESAQIDGYTPAANERVFVEYALVGPRFHSVMGIPLVSGREFDDRDGTTSRVVVVNESLARKYFAGRSAVGGFITMMGGTWEVIGVARDAKYHALNEEPRPYAYFPMLHFSGTQVGSPLLMVRAVGSASRMLPEVVRAVRGVDANVPVFGETTMVERLRETLAPQLAGAWLLGVFSGLALVVAAVGIYGIVAYTVSHRTRELGVRLALGAGGTSVVRLVVGSSLRFVALGIPLGLVLAAPMARAMTEFLYGVRATDAVTLAGTSLVMLLVGGVASYLPARRVARIDPLVALRADN